MTDDELKALVAGLAIDSKSFHELQMITAEQMKATAEQIRHNDKMLTEKFDRLSHASDRRDKLLTEKLDRRSHESSINEKLLTEKLTHVGTLLGNMGKNHGDVAEEFFFNSLANNTCLGNIHFDDIEKNTHKRRDKVEEEYDIIMTNANAIGIVEVKYKVHENDLDKLDRKMKNFKKLFPVYQNYKQYGALASFHINDLAKEKALRRGYFVLQRSGNLVHTESSEHLTVL